MHTEIWPSTNVWHSGAPRRWSTIQNKLDQQRNIDSKSRCLTELLVHHPRPDSRRKEVSEFKAASRIPKAANEIAEWVDVLEHARFDPRFFSDSS